jgi:hypothetical protein
LACPQLCRRWLTAASHVDPRELMQFSGIEERCLVTEHKSDPRNGAEHLKIGVYEFYGLNETQLDILDKFMLHLLSASPEMVAALEAETK